jgi:hypothetical protein
MRCLLGKPLCHLGLRFSKYKEEVWTRISNSFRADLGCDLLGEEATQRRLQDPFVQWTCPPCHNDGDIVQEWAQGRDRDIQILSLLFRRLSSGAAIQAESQTP